MSGFDPHAREKAPSQAWVLARNSEGHEKMAWLQTMDSYDFTAAAGVRSVEKVLAENPMGATTPALAFGADFVLEIPETERVDILEPSSEERSIRELRPS